MTAARRLNLAGAVLAAVCALAGAIGASQGRAADPSALLTVWSDVESASLTTATYSVTVKNWGPQEAQAAKVTVPVPASTTVTSADPAAATGCAPNASTGDCEWELGAIPVGATRTVRVSYALGAPRTRYTVSFVPRAEAVNAEAQSAPNSRLVHDVTTLSNDTWVDDAEAANTNHGACNQLKVARGNALTSYTDGDLGTTLFGAERIWGVELVASVTATTHPAGASASIGVHPVLQEFTEGDSDCAGVNPTSTSPTQPNEARTGDRPPAEAAPTAIAAVGAAGAEVRWNVAPAFDTPEERIGFHGFELRDAGSPQAGTVTFGSGEAASTVRPILVAVYTSAPREASCVDALSDAETAVSHTEQGVKAYATDGSRISLGATEACSGHPVAGADVRWTVEDDDPDAWISSLEGTSQAKQSLGGSAGPDRAGSSSDSEGQTEVGISVAEPFAVEPPDDTNEVYASLDDSTAGWSEPHDVVTIDWEPGVASTPPTGSGPPPGGGTTPPPSGPGPPVPAPRALTLSAPSVAPLGTAVALRGRLDSAAPACAGEGAFVRLLRRRAPAAPPVEFATVETGRDGSFELPLIVDVTALYTAVAPARTGCAEAASSTARVVAQGRVRAATSPRMARNRTAVIHGVGAPAGGGTVVLERWSGRAWRPWGARRVGRSGRFSLAVPVTWRGSRRFRLRWRPARTGYAVATSRALTIHAV